MLDNIALTLTLCAVRVHYSTTTRLATTHIFFKSIGLRMRTH